MEETDTSKCDTQAIASLLTPSELGNRFWRPSELGAVLNHQLSAPVEFDMGRLGRAFSDKVRSLAAADVLPPRSFNDLFHHPNPPVELLGLAKDFAKRHLLQTESPLPADIARILYFASIVVALVRCQRRISRLEDVKILEGVRWALARPWLDDATRSVFMEGKEALEGEIDRET